MALWGPRGDWVVVLGVLLCAGCSDAGGRAPDPPSPPIAPHPVIPSLPDGKPPPAGPPRGAAGGFRVTLPAMTLGAGAERFPCFLIPIAIDGPSRVVGAAVLRAPAGLHHGNITTQRRTGDGVRACPDSQFGNEAIEVTAGGVVLFASSTQHAGEEWYHFPDGMGFRVPEGHEIVAHMHYLNASTTPVVIAPEYEWYTIGESSLREELFPFVWMITGFQIPPHAEYTARAECELPETGMHIVTLLPHMHRLGRELTAGFWGGARDGELFLESPGYDPDKGVMVQYDPPVDVIDGWGVDYSCTWRNDGDSIVYEGFGAGEMCMLFGFGYPRRTTYSFLATAKGSCSAVGR